MTAIWLSIGLAAILFSILGLLLCIGGIIALWMAKERVEAVGKAAFVAADEAFAFVNDRLKRVRGIFESSRQQVSGLSDMANRLRNVEADAREASEPLLQSLDAVFQELKSAESWLDSSHAVAKGVCTVSEAVVSSKYANSHEDSVGMAITKRVQEVSASVAAVIARLQVMRQELVQLRDTGKLAREVVMKVVAWAADLDGMLANVLARLEKFDTKVERTKASADALHQRLHWWIAFAVVALTVLMAWFGISQMEMIGHGWRLIHNSLPSATAR